MATLIVIRGYGCPSYRQFGPNGCDRTVLAFILGDSVWRVYAIARFRRSHPHPSAPALHLP